MKNKLSILSFDNVPDPERSSMRNYNLTNSSQPSHLSFEHPFLAKGMLFGLCLKGYAKLRIDYKEYNLIPNSIFIVLPNQIFEPLEESEDHYVECLFFSTDFVNTLPLPRNFDVLNNMTLCPCLSVSDENMHELMEYHSFIVRVCNRSRHIHDEAVAKSLMYAFIALMASLYAETKVHADMIPNTRGTIIVDEFCKLLMKYHNTERMASFYSDKLCISTQYLSRTLKRLTGRSVNTWITEAVILEAKVLLKSSDKSIMEISEELNFPNPSFFIRYFKQYAGITPLKYRES